MRPLSRTRVTCTLAFCTMSSIVFAAGMLVPRPTAVADQQFRAGAQVKSDVVLHDAGPTQPPPQPQFAPSAAHPESVTPAAPVVQPPASANAQSSPSIVEPPHGDVPDRNRSESPARINSTDFSGKWSLVSSTFTGRGRGESGGGGGGGEVRKTTSIWLSGAPVNCGPECTIVQDAKTLTIRRSTSPEGSWVPDDGQVVLNLDGSDSTINHPSGTHYVVQAKWEGGTLVVTYHTPWNTTVTQVLSIDDGKLTVVTNFGVGDGPSTLTYVKG